MQQLQGLLVAVFVVNLVHKVEMLFLVRLK